MITGDRIKFIGMVLGLTFSTFIITQQSAIFIGLMQRTFGFITDTPQPDIWVVSKSVDQVDDIKPLKTTQLLNVRGISGVKWAVPIFKGTLRARTQNGVYQNCTLIGVDDTTLIGAPPIMVKGDVRGIVDPNGVIVDIVSARTKLAIQDGFDLIPMRMGEVFEINDKRAEVRGFCKVTRTFRTEPVIYTSLQQALTYAPRERNLLSYILVKATNPLEIPELCQKIQDFTGLAAYSKKEFVKLTVVYFLTKTGIPLNFGVAVFLGVIIGAAISGQTFFNFVNDNLKFFAAFKAMGASKEVLTKMVFVQAFYTATIGWGLGIGLTSLFGFASSGSELSFALPWWLFVSSALCIYSITICSAFISLQRILRLEPSIVFQS
jgi:putative ABC transport system permease protein